MTASSDAPHDPFRGSRRRGGPGPEQPGFPEDRLRQAGATDEQLAVVRRLFDEAPAESQRAFASAAPQIDDDTLLAQVEVLVRSAFDSAEHKVDDVKAAVEADPALLQQALDTERARGKAARKTLVEHLEAEMAKRTQGARQTGDGEGRKTDAAVIAQPENITPATDAATGEQVRDVPTTGQPAVDAGTGEQVDDVPGDSER